MFHYTTASGYKAISSQRNWLFKASTPPGSHHTGAYFTTLDPHGRNLAIRLRIPKDKLEFVFAFSGQDGLEPLEGGRGEYVFWSPVDYNVEQPRQVYAGPTEEMR